MSEEWFWEGNIVRCVCNYLAEQGWALEKVADTSTRETGPDICARRNNDVLLVEVKGFPSRKYARGENQGQQKRTVPATQARNWYSQALLSAILMQAAHPDAFIAIAFPYVVTYTSLIQRTQHALVKLSIAVYMVNETGVVEILH